MKSYMYNKSASIRIKKIAFIFVVALAATTVYADGALSSFLNKESQPPSSPIEALAVIDNPSLMPALPEDEVPSWVRDSERLSQLLGGEQVGEVSDARVIKRLPTPIEGLDALVIEGIVSDGQHEPHSETFVIYTDRGGRYLVAGLVIDMEQNRNLGQMINRQVRGERADNPALALNPMEMHGIDAEAHDESNDERLFFVVDLGPQKGRQNLLNIINRRQELLKKNQKLRPLRIVLVSSATDEIGTAAMAMAMGYDQMQAGEGFNRLIEYAQHGNKATWLDKDRLREDPILKQALGLGIFLLDDNSTQALLARIDILPLVYIGKEKRIQHIQTPISIDEWDKVLSVSNESGT